MNIVSNVQKPHGDAIDDVKRIKNTFSLHMWTKFGDDWSELRPVTREMWQFL